MFKVKLRYENQIEISVFCNLGDEIWKIEKDEHYCKLISPNGNIELSLFDFPVIDSKISIYFICSGKYGCYKNFHRKIKENDIVDLSFFEEKFNEEIEIITNNKYYE